MRIAPHVVLVVFAAFAIPLGSGCKDDPAPAADVDAGAEGGPTALTVEAENFLKSVCSFYGPCCAKATPGASDTCLGATSANARGKQFDSVRAKSCLEALATESKKKAGAFCAHAPDAPSCSAVFKIANAKAPGSACTLSEECANEGGEANGVCHLQKCLQVKRGKDGDGCIGTRINGTTDVRGKKTSDTSICLATDNIYCDDTTGVEKCKPRGAIGGTCTFGPGACVDTGYCPDTKQCVARTEKGVTCTQDDECAAGLHCVADDTGTAKCLAYEIEGGTCIRGDECDPRDGLVCDSGATKCIVDASVFSTACLGSLALR